MQNYQATPEVSYYYDNLPNAKGKLIKVTNGVGDDRSTTEYTAFDILGRVTAHKQTTDNNQYTTGYQYNLAGALIEQTYPSGRVVRNTLDSNGDLMAVLGRKPTHPQFWAYANNFKYSAAGAATSMQLGNGLWESTQFNNRLQPIQIALGTVQNGTDKLKLDYEYGALDVGTGQTIAGTNNGNVSKQTITVGSVGATPGFIATQYYAYDSLNRIEIATENILPDGQTLELGWRQRFKFDRYGNRNFVTTGETATTTLGTCPTEICNPSISPDTNKLTATGYAFDDAGNTTRDAQSRKFTYDAENKQTKVETLSGSTVTGKVGEYLYDGDGKRIKKRAYVDNVPTEETIFVYDAAGKLIGEYSNQIASSQDAKIAYLTNDHLGSPRINTDINGNVTARHDYHPFGGEIANSKRAGELGYASDTVRKQFTGYERDGETELDFAQARYYNNKHGRFASVDPLLASAKTTQPQSWNRYVYCWNNPIKLVDPDGMDVVALDPRAQELIILTLPAAIREKVQAAFEKGKGTLTRNSLNRIDSNDENFKALKTLVNNKEITEAATASIGNNGVTFFDTTVGERTADDLKNYKASNPNASKEDLDKLFPPLSDPTAREAYLGQTYSPNGEDDTPASPSGNLRAVVTDATGPAARVSEEDQVATMAHELYGHSYYFRTGNKTWRGEGPVMDAIEQRAVKNYRDGEVKKQSPGNLKPKQ